MERNLDESLRRLGAIFASPSLAMHYTHTTPALELSYLRRLGLTKAEAEGFVSLLCENGLLDAGARSVLEPVAASLGCDMAAAARQMLRDGLSGSGEE